MNAGFNQSLADKKYQLCWRPKQVEAKVQDSSSESSSSTESETDDVSVLEDGFELL